MADETVASTETLPEPIELPELGYVYVTDAEGLAAAVADLSGSPVLGVDTESDSFFSHTERCCLVQVTGVGTVDYVLDPLKLDDLSLFGPLMEDPNVVKIFHGADYDVVSMKRDFGFAIRNIFDTMIAAQATGHHRFGLNDLVGRYFGVKLNKKWQRHDWSSRPLREEHLNYARNDSHFLAELRRILMEQASARGREEMLAEEFALLENREWTGKPFEPDSCMRVKGSGTLDSTQRKVLRAVHTLRETIAESKNRPPFKVWGNDDMLKLARTPPKDVKELRHTLGEKHHIGRRYAREVLEAVAAGLHDESPPPEPPTKQTRSIPGVPPFSRDDEPLMAHLKKWRNARSKQLELAPGMIVNNTILKDLAALKPTDVAQMHVLPDLRRWQAEQFGEDLVEQVRKWIEAHPAQPRRKRRRRRRKGKGDEGGADAAPTAPAGAATTSS